MPRQRRTTRQLASTTLVHDDVMDRDRLPMKATTVDSPLTVQNYIDRKDQDPSGRQAT